MMDIVYLVYSHSTIFFLRAMLTPTIFANTSLIGTYDRSGRPAALLRSEPVRPVMVLGKQDGTTADKYQDQVSLSPGGLEKSRNNEGSGQEGQSADGAAEAGGSPRGERASTDPQGLTQEETKMLRELQARDREVKAHEIAHLASAGQYARGGTSYTYQQGPDRRRYAIGGEVSIDVGKEATPEKTIQKMEVVRRAALAPAKPSSADRAIAANASVIENQARQELHAQKTADARQQRGNKGSTGQKDQARSSSSSSTMASERRAAVSVFA